MLQAHYTRRVCLSVSSAQVTSTDTFVRPFCASLVCSSRRKCQRAERPLHRNGFNFSPSGSTLGWALSTPGGRPAEASEGDLSEYGSKWSRLGMSEACSARFMGPRGSGRQRATRCRSVLAVHSDRQTNRHARVLNFLFLFSSQGQASRELKKFGRLDDPTPVPGALWPLARLWQASPATAMIDGGVEKGLE